MGDPEGISMKKFLAVFVSVLSFQLSSLVSAQNPAAIESKPANTAANDNEKTFYALGAMLGKNISVFKPTSAELKFITMGLRDSVEGKKLQVEPDAFRQQINDLAGKRAAVEAEKEKKRGESYLDKASKEAGAKKTASGLIYKSLKEGTGDSPKPEDTVKVNYRGMFPEGKEFDSSYSRGEPTEFPLNGVIPCWTEGLQLMKKGGKARLVCPSSIAYGDRGQPPTIPGGATLVFEVELLDITKK